MRPEDILGSIVVAAIVLLAIGTVGTCINDDIQTTAATSYHIECPGYNILIEDAKDFYWNDYLKIVPQEGPKFWISGVNDCTITHIYEPESNGQDP